MTFPVYSGATSIMVIVLINNGQNVEYKTSPSISIPLTICEPLYIRLCSVLLRDASVWPLLLTDATTVGIFRPFYHCPFVMAAGWLPSLFRAEQDFGNFSIEELAAILLDISHNFKCGNSLFKMEPSITVFARSRISTLSACAV